jgi:TPR repeat protein
MRNSKQQRAKFRIARLKAKAKAGDQMAACKVSAEYRIIGRQRLAFRWWKKAADLGDGDAWLEVGYCYHYGIGTRRDLGAAAKAYDAAVRSQATTVYGMQEAMYHRAVLLLQNDGSRWSRANASKLLRQASKDGDYPQAEALFSSIKSGG